MPSGKFLYNNVKQAVLLQQELGPLVGNFKDQNDVIAEDIAGWHTAEREYLKGLQSEPEEVGLKIDYICLLKELWEAE